MKNLLLLLIMVSGLAHAQARGPAYESPAYAGPPPVRNFDPYYWQKRAIEAQQLQPLQYIPALPPERAAQVPQQPQYTGPQVPSDVQVKMRDMVR